MQYAGGLRRRFLEFLLSHLLGALETAEVAAPNGHPIFSSSISIPMNEKGRDESPCLPI
jgi:hypothetical protein